MISAGQSPRDKSALEDLVEAHTETRQDLYDTRLLCARRA